MSLQLFNPFSDLIFNDKICFLTGEELRGENEFITIFPEWVINNYNYRGKSFTMMDNVTQVKYEDLKLPCSTIAREAFLQLDLEIEEAFSKGYTGIKSLDEQRLFLWMGKFVYGILYLDLLLERKKMEKQNKKFDISPVLKKRFGLFHLMLQSLVHPFEFRGTPPWSISIVRLKYSKDIFNFRDSTVNLLFSLGVNGFGIIASLQDSGAVKEHYKELLDKIGTTVLHPIQFEELCAKFLYSNYLLQYPPKYKIEIEDSLVSVVSKPIDILDHRPLFGKWDENMFAQVLSGYWEVWGLTKNNIINFPNSPISFLENERTYELISPDTIELPF
ncbi:MAG: hypothetical protein LC105_12280 [Chitinophagales bacterium]|nr:hypothetical protein [Chitinophagales bacterium]MCZ2394629.1 hypothetical protein [Chitinophagales bacterium]